MLNTLKECAKVQEAVKRTRSKLGEPVLLQVIPPPIPSPEEETQQPPPVLMLTGEAVATSNMHNIPRPPTDTNPVCSLPNYPASDVLKKEDDIGEDAKPLTISDKLIKGKHVEACD
ncbi:hypothetical protein LIER_33629 [Lithospermum erythrorhizon]|uniref:Uncharacterized protein n=1 Tax=Lithospermum erythrorhizon TaxID=34254 RepID=A0AAV3S2W1_LITER